MAAHALHVAVLGAVTVSDLVIGVLLAALTDVSFAEPVPLPVTWPAALSVEILTLAHFTVADHLPTSLKTRQTGAHRPRPPASDGYERVGRP